MNYSLLMSTRRMPALLAALTGDLHRRGLFPLEFSCSVMGGDHLLVRMELECDAVLFRSIQEDWTTCFNIEMMIVSPLPATGPVNPVGRPECSVPADSMRPT